jgi:hypothetical protein
MQEDAMQRTLAVMLVVALMVPGCAAARSTTSAQSGAPPVADPVIGTFVRSLPAGSKVRVEIAHGRTLRGTLLQATDASLMVQRNTRIPEPPVTVPMRDVQRVTIDAPASNSRGMALGAVVGAGTAIGLLWLIAAIVFND